jgi:glycosyltransferase involved in cell wall biosynthesis
LIEQIERVAAQRFTALIAATPFIGERFQKFNENTEVINNFPWRNEFSGLIATPWQERSNAVGYIGACTRVRGIFEMIRAMEYVDTSYQATLEIGGHFGPPTLQEQIKDLKGWGSVNFRGYLSRRHVNELLGRIRAGLVVLHPEPNYVNSHPTKLFEYMAAGLPIIASDFPFWRSIVSKADCAYFVNLFVPEEIGKAIEWSISDSDKAKRMGQSGQELIRESYNWENESQKLICLYSKLLAR